MQGKKLDWNSEFYLNECRERLLSKRNINKNGCWLWSGCVKEGNYGIIRAKGINFLVHRLAYELFVSDPKGYFVCHKCDNPICFNPKHMFLGDQFSNMGDASKKKRVPSGVDHYNNKLTIDQVKNIGDLRKQGWSLRKIAKYYGVSYSCIHQIDNGTTWRHYV